MAEGVRLAITPHSPLTSLGSISVSSAKIIAGKFYK